MEMKKASDLSQVKAAIFDLDGTLTDSAGMWLDSRQAFFRDFSLQGSEAQVKAMIPLGIDGASRYVIQEFGLKNTEQEISKYWMDYAAHRYSTDIQLKPGVKEYLESLKEAGVHICLATGCKLPLAHIPLQRFGIAHYFEYEICADTLGGDKSDPAIFKMCARHLGLSPGECAVFEDSAIAIRAAYRAGFYTVAIEDAHSAYALETIRQNCDRSIADYTALL